MPNGSLWTAAALGFSQTDSRGLFRGNWSARGAKKAPCDVHCSNESRGSHVTPSTHCGSGAHPPPPTSEPLIQFLANLRLLQISAYAVIRSQVDDNGCRDHSKTSFLIRPNPAAAAKRLRESDSAGEVPDRAMA
jgi:hypothetical protein